jgi:peptidoglycan/xylan/chitin deacetylase (PgdA/CDA1 family)
MLTYRRRCLSVAAVLGLALAAGVAAPATLIAPAAAATSPAPSPSPSNEGPAGPPALMPNGRVASPPSVASPQISTGCPSAPSGVYSAAPGGGKTVALTFDDGPGKSTAQILSILSSAQVTATFFNLGENSAAQPSQVRYEAQLGFMLGNHTWDHPNMTTLSASAQGTEMDRATAGQTSLIGLQPCAFRPPGGSYNTTTRTLAQQRRMKFWTWSVDTEDWKANGSSSSYWVKRIISLAEKGGSQSHPVVLMHNQPAGNPATVLALPTIINFYRSRGYAFVDLLGRAGLGYVVLTSDGGVHNYGAPWYGSDAGRYPAGVTAVALAANPATGGYWILKSDGGVDNFGAPWYGSLRGAIPAGQTVTGLAASPVSGGYWILTSNGGVHNYGAPWYGSAAGTLTGGVTAAGLAADTVSGGYLILKSNGGVANYHAPWYGSLTGQLPSGQSVTAIAGQ